MTPLRLHRNNNSGLKNIGKSLQHRNYRLFFSGQGISLIGTWMQQVAMSWLVYRLTGSPFFLGLISFTGQAPMLFLAPVAGVLADRIHRQKLLVITQTLGALQAFVLAFLTLTGYIQVWYIVFLSLFLGCINAFDIPTRQSFVVEMVDDKTHLANAIALNSSIFNAARLIGPSIAGVIVSLVGEGFCFLINAISFFAIIGTLLAMNVPRKKIKDETSPIFQGLIEGYRYAFGFPPIRYLLLLLGLAGFVGMPYIAFMPFFARDILHGGPHTLGFLMGAGGVGALTGTLYLASRASVIGLGRLTALAACIFGVSLFAFSFSQSIPLSFFILFFAGFGMIIHMASTNTLIQTVVDEDKRGRIMSLYAMAFGGTTPFGCLLAGFIATKIGVQQTVLIGGLICIAGSLLFMRKLPHMKEAVTPVYTKMGIVYDMSTKKPRNRKEQS